MVDMGRSADLLARSAANKEKYNKERLDSYYRRNYQVTLNTVVISARSSLSKLFGVRTFQQHTDWSEGIWVRE